MCRHLAYVGPSATLAALLLDPPHGLLHQSYAPADMRGGGTVNADGFGAGWYRPAAAEPVRYRSDRPLWTDRNLVVLGCAGNKGVAEHLKARGTFSYDKVLEKVTKQYPGPGRGVIQIVESINSAVYDSTGKCRHAVLVEGSDEAGTLAAVEKLMELI